MGSSASRGATGEPCPGPDVVLAQLAHGMRTALHTAAGHAELLAGTPLRPEQRRHVDAIRAALARLGALVTDAMRRAPPASRPVTRATAWPP